MGANGMKIDRHGRAKILTQHEIQLLFNQGFTLYDEVATTQTPKSLHLD